MNTQIGIISGEILELLEQSNGLFVFGEIQSNLQRPHDLVLMSLGWLLCEGYIQILEDPLRACYKNNDQEKTYTMEASMFDLIVEKNAMEVSRARVKNMVHHISAVAAKILVILEGCGGLLTLQTIERNLSEHRDIVLMSLGWLIREGYVRGVAGIQEVFIFRLSKEMAGLNTELSCLV